MLSGVYNIKLGIYGQKIILYVIKYCCYERVFFWTLAGTSAICLDQIPTKCFVLIANDIGYFNDREKNIYAMK